MKPFYKYIFFASFILFFVCGTYAQSDSKKEKIEALRAAFINKKVNFAPKEAEAFWPLYNEMNDKLDAVRKAFRQKYNSNTNYNFETDKEAEEYLNAELLVKQKEYEINKEYYDKFKKILPVKKVAAVRKAEKDFIAEVIKSAGGGN